MECKANRIVDTFPTVTEMRGFEYIIMYMKNCNYAGFVGNRRDSLNRMMCTVLAANVEYNMHPIVNILTMKTEIHSLE